MQRRWGTKSIQRFVLSLKTNISKEVYDSIKMKNLGCEDDLGKTLDSKYGRVLLDERFAGKVFVKGLYV